MGCKGDHFGALMGPQWSEMVDMSILDRYETSRSKKMVGKVIFGVEYLIIAMETKMIGKRLFLGMCGWPFWGPDRAPMVTKGRYTNPG